MIILVITSMGINTVMPMTIIILRATPTITARGRRVRMRPA
jgi:hypothetical protein